jgi:hypothetical protein
MTLPVLWLHGTAGVGKSSVGWSVYGVNGSVSNWLEPGRPALPAPAHLRNGDTFTARPPASTSANRRRSRQARSGLGGICRAQPTT